MPRTNLVGNEMNKLLTSVYAIFITILVMLGWSIVSANSAQSFSNTGNSHANSVLVSSGSKKLSDYYQQKLDWSGCNNGFECSTLVVPMDYAHIKTSPTLQLSIIRLKSKTAVGSLILNPGGPGGSGIDYARAAKYVVTSNLIKRYDIVGFDPRGVGLSTPVHCLTDSQTDTLIAADGTPDNQSEVNSIVSLAKVFARGCAVKSDPTYRFVDTVSAARDIDILRSALGDPKLNWLGKSYGTFLGATYAKLFPTKVGRMVLDGAIDPRLSNQKLSYGQALGFENALHRFAADCVKRSNCPLTGNSDVAFNQIVQFIDRMDANPKKLSDGRTFTQAMAMTGILGSLYDKVYGWPQLRKDLQAALRGDYSGLVSSLDWYTSRGSDGKFTDNSNDAIAAVNCLDRPDRATIAQTKNLARVWSKKAPVFGAYLAWSNVSCTYWPIPATGKPETITASGSPNILVVGTTNDPATPYPWAKALAAQLSKGLLLTLNGDGHTAYMQGSSCIDRIVDAYYVTGNATNGTTCNDAP